MTNLFLNLIYGAVGIAGLYYGADMLVKGGVDIAKKIGVSPLIIGLTLVAYATSAPEMVVSVSAALNGNADIAIGNIVGSNICNIVLILGICACITPMAVQHQLLKFDAPIMLGATILLAVFYFTADGLTRIQGAVLFAGILLYTWWCIRYTRKNEGSASAAASGEETKEEQPQKKQRPLFLALLLVAGGFTALIVGAKTFLWCSVYFAKLFHLSDAVIGLTVVAVGTSLPELATSVVAAVKKEDDIAIGNVLGSNIFNILGILGVTALIRPLEHATLNLVDLGVMLFCTAALLPVMRSGWKISRKEGIFFLLIYAAYTGYLILNHQ